ncbi:MAG: 2-oxo acid dehydrogenase subunit E2 [Holosporaceae bacterium]|jgi:pyruvate/2-oxoglutarate dehydrogenase complex dihydrolipoamide acyltransferase (E2) component|nr:2-oxo acid dehydrogenase subunit E2 [Holosporaceae bacterium]
MLIDIIVPNFDNSSEEVVLSSWYKKVGDKISKNEIVADAETPFVACGITSSHDCILVKILVKEGETIAPGTKIAVIETDLDATISEIKEEAKVVKAETLPDDNAAISIQEYKSTPMESTYDNKYDLSVPLNADAEIVEEVVEEFSEHAEEKYKDILKNAENQAREEAIKLKEKILEDTRKIALLQAEELKAKTLKEYEEKALIDAGEMHKKIIQGSIQEAGSTKTKLIEETREKAILEAKRLENDIITDAREKANLKAEKIIREASDAAREEAKLRSESLSREIIEKAIAESKAKAKAVKKDIICSARKHAVKISTKIIRKSAKTHTKQMEDFVASAIHPSLDKIDSLRKEILRNVREEIQVASNSLLNSIENGMRRNVTSMTGYFQKAIEDTNGNIKSIKSEIEKKIESRSGEKNAIAKTLLNTSNNDLCQKIKAEKDYQTKEQSEIIKKLLRVEEENSSPDLYADNWNKPQFFESPGDYKEPIDLLKRRISEKIKSTYDASVISTVSNEVDMSAVLALEKTFGNAFSKRHNVRLGFTPFFISACIAALKQYRIFNAHIHNDEIIYKNNFDISIITCGNDGIATPVIRHADTLTIAEIEKSMITLSKRAIEGTLSVEEVSGGTFTVINAGIYGSLIGTDLLTPPQVATLSVHKMHNRPVASDNNMTIKPMLYISLSYDHRISDTRKASEFLSNIKNYVENPGWQILGLTYAR